MKLILPSGYQFEGTVEELKLLKETKPELFTKNPKISNNQKLVDIIVKSSPQTHTETDTISKNTNNCFLTMDNGIMGISVSNTQDIGINFMIKSEDNDCIMLYIKEFNSNEFTEHITFSFNQANFSIIIDKKQTTKENICILDFKSDCDYNVWKSMLKPQLSQTTELAKLCIRMSLLMFDGLLKSKSIDLTIRDFGYTHF